MKCVSYSHTEYRIANGTIYGRTWKINGNVTLHFSFLFLAILVTVYTPHQTKKL